MLTELIAALIDVPGGILAEVKGKAVLATSWEPSSRTAAPGKALLHGLLTQALNLGPDGVGQLEASPYQRGQAETLALHKVGQQLHPRPLKSNCET